MKRLSCFITAVIILSACGDGRKDFSLLIRHFAYDGLMTVIFDIDEEGIEIRTVSEQAPGGDLKRVVFSRTFAKNESEDVYRFVNSLRLDTLQSFYGTEDRRDGSSLVTRLSFSKGFFSTYSTSLVNFHTPVTDSLFTEVNAWVPEQFRFFNWKYRE